jgi:hypothetical protein
MVALSYNRYECDRHLDNIIYVSESSYDILSAVNGGASHTRKPVRSENLCFEMECWPCYATVTSIHRRDTWRFSVIVYFLHPVRLMHRWLPRSKDNPNTISIEKAGRPLRLALLSYRLTKISDTILLNPADVSVRE